MKEIQKTRMKKRILYEKHGREINEKMKTLSHREVKLKKKNKNERKEIKTATAAQKGK